MVDQRSDGSVLIGGDNSSREFSAFDRALEFAGADIWSYDFVHFATSAFNTLYVAYLERFVPSLLAAAAGRPACIGHIDCYNEPVEVATYRPSTGSGPASSSCRRRKSRRSAASCRSPTAAGTSAAIRMHRFAPMRRSTASIANTSLNG